MAEIFWRQSLLIGGGPIFLVGGSGGETKIAEGIRDAKSRCFALYTAFDGKVGVAPSPPPPAPPPMGISGISKGSLQ